MNPDTLLALQGSIRKWEAIVAGTGEDKGCANCPLCQRFLRTDCATNDGEEFCPVAMKTKTNSCYGSPYEAWVNSLQKGKSDIRFAQAELDFLKSILPKE